MSSTVGCKASILLGLLLLCLLLLDAAAEWIETAKLADSDGEADDRFGYSVAIEDGILVVGAYLDDIGGVEDAGSATIWELSDDGEWVAPQKLTASDAEAFDFFGYSVAISNGVVAVGALWEDDSGDEAGAVYIYEKGADGTWTERQKLIPHGISDFEWFGLSLAMHGNTLAVGALGGFSLSRSAYFFTLLAAGIWSEAAKLTASDPDVFDYFGAAVAIDADTIVVGAKWDDDLGDESGSAYVFQREGEESSWTQQAKLTPSDGQADDLFGRAVAIGGGTLFVGSNNNADGENIGAVYQFGKEGGTWTQQNKLVARDFESYNRFGFGLAFRNGTLVVGAIGQNNNTGAVYVFQQEADDVWTQRANLAASDGATDDRFGLAVGVDDGIIIAAAYGDNSTPQGSVYAFEWRASETDVRPSAVQIPTSQPNRRPSALAAAPIATQSSGLQPFMAFVFVGIAFIAGGGAAWIYSRRKKRPDVPNQDVPNIDHRVVFTDDISELEAPSVANGIRSVEASVASKLHTLNAETPTIDHSQQTSHF